MEINHIALWAEDIEMLVKFYSKWFGAVAGERYHNPQKNFTSRFLSFPDGGASLEIMNVPETTSREAAVKIKGFCHIALSLGSKEAVDEMTERMREDGVAVVGEPRITGDGFYESVIADPEGNTVELTV